jgi:hypothetical protein
MSKEGNSNGTYYGIIDFQYDLIARILPGMGFLVLVLVFSPKSRCFVSDALPCLGQWWVAISCSLAVALAYLLGQLADGLLGWWLVDKFRDLQNRTRRKNSTEKTIEVLCREFYRDMPTNPERGFVRKSQTESRSLTNMGLLLLATWSLIMVGAIEGRNAEIARLAIFFWAIAFLLAGYHRQGYRVMAIRSNMLKDESATAKHPCWNGFLNYSFIILGVAAMACALYETFRIIK